MTAEGLAAAIAYHRAHETSWRRDFLTESGRYIGVNDEPPAPGDVLGPVRPRGGPNGVILRGGSIVAEWGDTHRADMTFSVAKSYLAALAGLALMRGLVKDLDDPVHQREARRSEEHTSELQSPCNLVCRLLLEKKKKKTTANPLRADST